MKKKYFLDTNIFLRFLLNDHSTLSPKAKKYFNLLSNNQVILISNSLVIAEVVWVLKSFYKYSHIKVNNSLTPLLSHKNLKINDKPSIFKTLDLCQRKNLDFVDAYIHIEASKRKIKLITFDKKLNKLSK
ncbi:MAG: PIN domain-containing protein [Candidatus Beckwithbacteria bacterium]